MQGQLFCKQVIVYRHVYIRTLQSIPYNRIRREKYGKNCIYNVLGGSACDYYSTKYTQFNTIVTCRELEQKKVGNDRPSAIKKMPKVQSP